MSFKTLLARAIRISNLFFWAFSPFFASAAPGHDGRCEALFSRLETLQSEVDRLTARLTRIESYSPGFREYWVPLEQIERDRERLKDAVTGLTLQYDRELVRVAYQTIDAIDVEIEELNQLLSRWFTLQETRNLRSAIADSGANRTLNKFDHERLQFLLELSNARSEEHGFGRRTVRAFFDGLLNPELHQIAGVRRTVRQWRSFADKKGPVKVDPHVLRSAMATYRRAVALRNRLREEGVSDSDALIALEYAPWQGTSQNESGLMYIRNQVHELFERLGRKIPPQHEDELLRFVRFCMRDLQLPFSEVEKLYQAQEPRLSRYGKNRVVPDIDLYSEVAIDGKIERTWMQVFSTTRALRSSHLVRGILESIERKLDQLTLLPQIEGSRRVFVIDSVKSLDFQRVEVFDFIEALKRLSNQESIQFEIWHRGVLVFET